jgi:FlaA1/EpsC-like NDP-sugar epimerase
LEPGRDIEIEFTGIRPGEKLSEELWEKDKIYERTPHPDILRSQHEDSVSGGDLAATLERLHALAQEGRSAEIIALLDRSIPGALITEAPAQDMTSIV